MKLVLYKSIYRPVLTYGSEAWAIIYKVENKIQAAEIRYLRAITGNSRRDHIRNTIIRAALKSGTPDGKNYQSTLRLVWSCPRA